MAQRYPLMIRDKNGKPFTDNAGNLIVVSSVDEETAFHTDHPDAEPVPPTVDPLTPEQQIEALQADNAKLKDELHDLNEANAALEQEVAKLADMTSHKVDPTQP